MQCIGFEGIARVFLGDLVQGASTSEVDAKCRAKNQNRGETRFDVHGMEKKPRERFIDNVERGEHQEACFQKSREVLELAVAVGMARVGGLIGKPYRQERDDRGDQVQARMQGF